MSKKNPYEGLSLDELAAENQLLMQEKARLRARQIVLNEMVTARTREQIVARETKRIKGLLGEDTQDIAPEGIASKEAIGDA